MHIEKEYSEIIKSLKGKSKDRGAHGLSKTKLYKTWKGFLSKCQNPRDPQYYYYGQRGVKVCDAWHKLENFIIWALENGYRDDLVLSRIDANGNYEPSNCMWTTKTKASQNRRFRVTAEINGEKHNISEISKQTGFSYCRLYRRILNGWSGEELLLENRAIIKEKKKCCAPGCDNKHYAKGYCQKHLVQIKKHGRLTPERERKKG